jgi:thiamine-phosphate pyrophosphorylase
MNREQLKDVNLYLITDRTLFTARCPLYLAIETALEAGVKAVQLREKDLSTRSLLDMAYWMKELTNEYGAQLFINDRVDVALSVEAGGVHLGRESIPVQAVRKIAGKTLIIGVSTHTIGEAIEAEKDGADFITIGPVYETPAKAKYGKPVGLETLKEAKSRTTLPIFAIGGIKPGNVREVKEAGADGIALISAILTAQDIKKTTEDFLRVMK